MRKMTKEHKKKENSVEEIKNNMNRSNHQITIENEQLSNNFIAMDHFV